MSEMWNLSQGERRMRRMSESGTIPKVPAKKKKTVSTGAAKKRAWNAFSRYIRLRDAIKTTQTKTHARCCTCGTVYPAFGVGCLQAGHFIGGRHNSLLFDERGVNAQCYMCNVHKKGASAEYWLFMEKEHGREVIDDLIRLSRQVKQVKAYEHLEMAEYYEKKVKELENG